MRNPTNTPKTALREPRGLIHAATARSGLTLASPAATGGARRATLDGVEEHVDVAPRGHGGYCKVDRRVSRWSALVNRAGPMYGATRQGHPREMRSAMRDRVLAGLIGVCLFIALTDTAAQAAPDGNAVRATAAAASKTLAVKRLTRRGGRV